jgi:hypothetical protein
VNTIELIEEKGPVRVDAERGDARTEKRWEQRGLQIQQASGPRRAHGSSKVMVYCRYLSVIIVSDLKVVMMHSLVVQRFEGTIRQRGYSASSVACQVEAMHSKEHS